MIRCACEIFPYAQAQAPHRPLDFGIIVVVTGLVLLFLPPSPTPAQFLPAPQTVALFTNPTDATVAAWSVYFPVLKTVPFSKNTIAVAFVKLPDGSLAGVKFDPPDIVSSRPFTITLSSPAAATLLDNISDPLSKNAVFRFLSPDKAETRPWAFVRFGEIALDASVPLSHLLTPDRPVLLLQTPRGIELSFSAQSSEEFLPALTMQSDKLFDTPLFVLQASRPGAVLHATAHILKQEPSFVIESVLKTLLSSWFGPSLSMRYDLLPLLNNESSLQVGKDGKTQTLTFVLIGSLRGTTQDKEMLDALIHNFIDSLTTATRASHRFDDKYVLPISHIAPIRLIHHGTKLISNLSLHVPFLWSRAVVSNAQPKQ